MRKVQLSFRIEDFRDGPPGRLHGYIDANTYQELLYNLIRIFYEESGVEDFDEFCREAVTFDASKRFGATEVVRGRLRGEVGSNENVSPSEAFVSACRQGQISWRDSSNA